jgi:dTDP-4-amino-4,6-dideoxygalactose transaminase
MTGPAIPFNRAAVMGNETRYIQEAVANGKISGAGSFTQRCEDLLQAILGGGRALLTTSCTHALEMAALLLDIAPGDEVIVSAFTFVSSINAFVLRGARPVFADIRPDTLNLDERALPALLGPRTKAMVLTHYAGVGCEMEAIGALAAERGIPVIEDAAHGLFGSWSQRPLGRFGALATLSFHETKNVTCGEGGALLVNDERLVARAEILREKGTDRSRFFRGEVARYTWVDLGSSYVLSELLAAFLLAQLETRERIQAARHAIWARYREALADWAAGHDVGLPVIPAPAEHPAHLFYMLLPTAEVREALTRHLAAAGILAVGHYVPLDTSPFGALCGRGGPCPVAAATSTRLLRLPLFAEFGADDQERVIGAVLAFDGW